MENINKITNTELIDTKEREELRGQIVMSTMNNHLNAIKRFFGFLFKEGMATNVFNQIPDYDLFKQNDFPAINIGKRKVITLASYLLWKMNKKGGV